MMDITESLRRHVASYKSLSPHRAQCLEACDKIEEQAEEIERLTLDKNRLCEFIERGGIDSSAVLCGQDDGEWQDVNNKLHAALDLALEWMRNNAYRETDNVAKAIHQILYGKSGE